MKFGKNFWIWLSLLGGILTTIDCAHELHESHKQKKQLQIEQKEEKEEDQ